MFTSIGELTLHSSFGKDEVDSKSIVMPVSMWVTIRKVDSMGNDGKANFG